MVKKKKTMEDISRVKPEGAPDCFDTEGEGYLEDHPTCSTDCDFNNECKLAWEGFSEEIPPQEIEKPAPVKDKVQEQNSTNLQFRESTWLLEKLLIINNNISELCAYLSKKEKAQEPEISEADEEVVLEEMEEMEEPEEVMEEYEPQRPNKIPQPLIKLFEGKELQVDEDDLQPTWNEQMVDFSELWNEGWDSGEVKDDALKLFQQDYNLGQRYTSAVRLIQKTAETFYGFSKAETKEIDEQYLTAFGINLD